MKFMLIRAQTVTKIEQNYHNHFGKGSNDFFFLAQLEWMTSFLSELDGFI